MKTFDDIRIHRPALAESYLQLLQSRALLDIPAAAGFFRSTLAFRLSRQAPKINIAGRNTGVMRLARLTHWPS